MNTQRLPSRAWLRGILIGFVILFALQSPGMAGRAAPAIPLPSHQSGGTQQALTCTPTIAPLQYCDIEIVLMIDDSGSMRTNDVDGIRNQGAKDLVDILAQEYYLPAVLARADNPELRLPVINVAVVHFSYKVRNLEPVTWITIDPGSSEEWNTQRVRLYSTIDERNPGYELTSFIEPFEAAKGLFEDSQITGSDCVRRSILLLTDGTPEDSRGRLQADDLRGHMSTVESLIRDFQAPLPEDQNVEIYVTGFKVDPRYWSEVDPPWSEIIGPPSPDPDLPRAELLEGQDALIQLLSRIGRITASAIGVESVALDPQPAAPADPGPPGSQYYSLEIPRHTQSLRLTLYNLDPDASLTIIDDQGTEITADGENVILSGENSSVEVWRLITPPAGSYEVQASQQGGIITKLLVFQNLAVEFDSEAGQLQAFQPADIRFSLVDDLGSPVLPGDDPTQSLKLDVSLVSDAGGSAPLDWTRDGDGYRVSWTPSSPGEYQVQVEASFVDINGDTSWQCAGTVELIIPPPQPALVIEPPACVSPAEATTFPLQLIHEGDTSWASSLQWNVTVVAMPGGQDVSATVNTVDATTGDYEIVIDPIDPIEADDIQVQVSAAGEIDGRSVQISDGETTTIGICDIPPPPCCGGAWIFWFWPLAIALALVLIVLLVLRFRPRREEKSYQQEEQDISRTGYWHLLFWPLLILLILLILNRWLWCCVIPLWLFLGLILILLIILLLVWFLPGAGRRLWWLIALSLLLLVFIWYIFSGVWLYLVWILVWFLAILILVWVVLWRISPPPPPDDLTLIEGIGPKVQGLLYSRGITTFKQIAAGLPDLEEIDAWLNEQGWDYMNPKTWARQAQLAEIARASGSAADWKRFEDYKKYLKKGLPPEDWKDDESY